MLIFFILFLSFYKNREKNGEKNFFEKNHYL